MENGGWEMGNSEWAMGDESVRIPCEAAIATGAVQERFMSEFTKCTNVHSISGHLDRTPEELAMHYQPAIDEELAKGESFVVGDARVADAMVQQYLLGKTTQVVVYHMFTSPRNKFGFLTLGGLASDEARNAQMTTASDRDIAWVRPGREKSGTQKNLNRRKQISSKRGRVVSVRFASGSPSFLITFPRPTGSVARSTSPVG
jgi:hypothetical protein